MDCLSAIPVYLSQLLTPPLFRKLNRAVLQTLSIHDVNHHLYWTAEAESIRETARNGSWSLGSSNASRKHLKNFKTSQNYLVTTFKAHAKHNMFTTDHHRRQMRSSGSPCREAIVIRRHLMLSDVIQCRAGQVVLLIFY